MQVLVYLELVLSTQTFFPKSPVHLLPWYHIFSFITSLQGYGLESILSFRLVIFLYLENICQLLPSGF